MFGRFLRPRPDDVGLRAGDESPATRYVREVISTAIDRRLDTCEITAQDGAARCPLVDEAHPYVQVRNRIAIMTDTIRSYDNRTDQQGTILVRYRQVDYDITVEDRAVHGGIRLCLRQVHRPFQG